MYDHDYTFKTCRHFSLGYSQEGDFAGATLELKLFSLLFEFTPWGTEDWADYFSDTPNWQSKILDIDCPDYMRIFGLEISIRR